jgi:D-inositol-3-phosphate glycosyltransferase
MEKEEKLKGLFIGDMVAETGFSTVMHNIIKHNLDDFDVTGVGVNYNGDPHDYDYPIFPAMIGGKGNIYGLDRVCNILNSKDFDFIFMLNDSWVLSYYLDAIKKNVKKRLPKIVVYFPVDSKYHQKDWYRDFDVVNKAVTYTQFGKDVVNDPNCMPDLKLETIPHGTDLGTFYKMYENRHEARQAYFGDKLKHIGNLEDMFIVLNTNRNQPRKKLDITIKGFSLFAKNKPIAVQLYMHAGIVDSNINIIREAKRYGIDNRLIFTSMNPGIQRIPKERLNLLYNTADVGINTSLGEGWGLTNVEHAVTGALQVVPRHSSCQELFSDCGLLMETSFDWTFDSSETVGRVVTPEEVARCLEVAYTNQELRLELAEKGRKKFTQPEYEWKSVAQKFGDIFREVCKQDVATVSADDQRHD